MRFSVRDLMWLVTGIAISFAILGSVWRREYASWNKERALLREEHGNLKIDVEKEMKRARQAERNLKGIMEDLENPEVIKELVISAEAKGQNVRPSSSPPIQRPR